MLNHREEAPIDILPEAMTRSVHPLMALVVTHTAGLPPVVNTASHLQAIEIGVQSRVTRRILHHYPAIHSTRRPVRTRPTLLTLFVPALHLRPFMYHRHHHHHHHHLNAQLRRLRKVSNPQQTFIQCLVSAEVPQPLILRKRIVL